MLYGEALATSAPIRSPIFAPTSTRIARAERERENVRERPSTGRQGSRARQDVTFRLQVPASSTNGKSHESTCIRDPLYWGEGSGSRVCPDKMKPKVGVLVSRPHHTCHCAIWDLK